MYRAFIVKGNKTREISQEKFMELCYRYEAAGSYANFNGDQVMALRAVSNKYRLHSVVVVRY